MALLLVTLWLISGFDLVFTILAHRIGEFREVNPLAARLLDNTMGLMAFKISLVVFASVVLLACRRHKLVEIGCWLLAATYFALAGIWSVYFLLLHT